MASISWCLPCWAKSSLGLSRAGVISMLFAPMLFGAAPGLLVYTNRLITANNVARIAAALVANRGLP